MPATPQFTPLDRASALLTRDARVQRGLLLVLRGAGLLSLALLVIRPEPVGRLRLVSDLGQLPISTALFLLVMVASGVWVLRGCLGLLAVAVEGNRHHRAARPPAAWVPPTHPAAVTMMAVCVPCQEEHQPADCVDSIADRQYPHRVCVCQHKPRRALGEELEAEQQTLDLATKGQAG